MFTLEAPNPSTALEWNDAGEGSSYLYALFDINVVFNKMDSQTDAPVTANSLKKPVLLCTKDGDRCGSDLLSQIQNPELVEVVEAGFDHAAPEIASVQVHDGCGGQRAQVRVDSQTGGTNTREPGRSAPGFMSWF